MNQHEAPDGTLAAIGHPANGRYVQKIDGEWRVVGVTFERVDPEDFQAGWHIMRPTP